MGLPDYEWFTYLSSLYIIILNVLFFLLLWKRIFQIGNIRQTFQLMGKKDQLLVSGTILLLLLINLGCWLWPEPPFGIRYLLSAATILIYSISVHGRDSGKTVFALSLFYNLHSLCFLISISLYQCISDMLIADLNLNVESMEAVEALMEQLYGRVVIGQIFLLSLYTICFAIMIGIIYRILKTSLEMNHQAVLFLSILNIIGGMLGKMIADLNQVKIDQEVFQLYTNRREMLWKLPILAVLLFIGEISLIYFYQKYMELQKEKEQRFIEHQQVEAMKRRLEEAEQFYGSIRKVRHEMKNHMTNIKGLVAGEQYQEVDRYIAKLDATIQELDYKYATGHPVTDVIINDKYRKAQKLGIDFDAAFFFDEAYGIPAFDMGIILNNLLDNAIEACEKIEWEKRKIHLSLNQNLPFLMLTVENPYDGKALQKAGDGIPKTTKTWDSSEELPGHGLGLKNVKEIAERHLGGVSIQTTETMFRITVLLQQPASE